MDWNLIWIGPSTWHGCLWWPHKEVAKGKDVQGLPWGLLHMIGCSATFTKITKVDYHVWNSGNFSWQVGDLDDDILRLNQVYLKAYQNNFFIMYSWALIALWMKNLWSSHWSTTKFRSTNVVRWWSCISRSVLSMVHPHLMSCRVHVGSLFKFHSIIGTIVPKRISITDIS